MSKLLLLLLALVFGIVFEVAPKWDGVTYMTPDPFLFYAFPKEQGIAYQTWVYMICEYLITMIFIGIIAQEAKEYRFAIWVFFWLVVIDLGDYLLTYNSIWFKIGWLPVSMNILKVVIFGLVILKEWINSIGRQSFG